MQPDIQVDYAQHFEAALHQYIQTVNIASPRLKEALCYVLFPGGKRIRPLLIYGCGEIVSLKINALNTIAIAVELIHTYSLIHDDLPSMDNDDMRRGKPSCHIAFDEATAILTGDALHCLAFELLSELCHILPPQAVINVISALSKASGVYGMVAGQQLDLDLLTTHNLSLEQLKTIHSLKTGSLIEASVLMPLIAKENSSANQYQALADFGRHLGLAFQMQDDYLDHYGSPQNLGKSGHSDKKNTKKTFANFYDQSTLLELINDTLQQAENALVIFDKLPDTLANLLVNIRKRSIIIKETTI